MNFTIVKNKNEENDEEKIIPINENPEFIMGRKIYFKVPIINKMMVITYCEICQLILGFHVFIGH